MASAVARSAFSIVFDVAMANFARRVARLCVPCGRATQLHDDSSDVLLAYLILKTVSELSLPFHAGTL